MRPPVTGHDEPLEPADEKAAPFCLENVVQIGDFTAKYGRGKRYSKPCEHNRLVYSPEEKRVWCQDCESTVDPFDAFYRIVRSLSDGEQELKSRREALERDEDQSLLSRAAKAVDRAFRRRKMIPVCPHCKEGLLPEDVVNIDKRAMVSKELTIAKREKQKQNDSA